MQRSRLLQLPVAIMLASIVLFLSVGSVASATPSTVPASASEVSYPGVTGVTLAGTLLIPAHREGEHVPGVVIIAGSGPTDRNGNQAGGVQPDMYKQLAENLAQHGIASLRYDKRGVGASTPVPQPQNPQHPTPAEIAAIQNFAAWDNYVGDAAASLHYLQQQAAIDSARTALMGHSEGTYIAEQVAASPQPGTRAPAALVLLSGPGRTGDVLAREQIDNALKQEASSDIEAFVLQQYDAIIAGIKQTGQIDITAVLSVYNNAQVPQDIKLAIAGLFSIANNKFWQGLLQVVPTTLLKEYRGPVLVVQGTDDRKVFVHEDTPLLDQALRQRPCDDHLVLIVPHAGHVLKRVSESDPTGINGPIAPEVQAVLPAWLKVHLWAF